jgi:hypothetical protein
MRASKWGNKETFQSNIIFRKPVIRNHEIQLSWPEAHKLLDAAGIEQPKYLSDYRATVDRLARHLEFWSYGNLVHGLDTNVWGTTLEPKLQIFFQTKADMIKWKLSWWNL